MHACQWGQYQVCLFLLDRNAHVNVLDFTRRSALDWSLVSGASVRIVELLLERGVDVSRVGACPSSLPSSCLVGGRRRSKKRSGGPGGGGGGGREEEEEGEEEEDGSGGGGGGGGDMTFLMRR